MDATFGVVLTCVAFGAAIGIGWSGWLTEHRPAWQSQYANPRKWYSWVFGPMLCIALSVRHFVEGRPGLGVTFVTFAATAFFFLLTSAITMGKTKMGDTNFQASHRVLVSTSRGPLVEFCISGEEDASRGHKTIAYLEEYLDALEPAAVLLNFLECRQLFDNDLGGIIRAHREKDGHVSRPCAVVAKGRAAQSMKDLLKFSGIEESLGVKVFSDHSSALAHLKSEIGS